MKNFLRDLSFVLFAIALIALAFPFITSIYPNQEAIAMTGLDILQSRTEYSSELEPDLSKPIPTNPTFTNENLIPLSALCASIGVATSVLNSPQSKVITAIASGLGSAGLWMFKNRNEQVVLRGEEGVERIDFGLGFIASFSSYVAVFIISILRLFQRSKLR